MTARGNGRRACLALVLSMLVASAAAAEVAVPTTPDTEVLQSALSRVGRVQDRLATRRLADAVSTAAVLLEVPVATPSTAPPRALAGLPLPLAEPLARLHGAVVAASHAVARGVHADPADVAAQLHGLDERYDALAPDDVPGARRLAAEAQALAADAADVSVLLGGAVGLAAAIDRALPALHRYAASVPSPPHAVTGCDVVDLPALCVGGTGANTYASDRPLVLDLGGDDVHLHSAGGADARDSLPVAVTIELGGNDRYQAQTPSRAGLPAQGAATAGIGVLLDVAGNDSYDAEGLTTEAHGQGFGALGVGVLADLAGNDRYHLRRAAMTAGLQNALGLGYGSVGAGIFVDAAGDDVYTLEARPAMRRNTDGLLLGGSPFAQGFGTGALGGAALFADGGGRDSMTMVAGSEALEPTAGAELAQPPGASVEGMGYGSFGGAALALAGAGDTRWTAEAAVGAPRTAVADVDAFGASDAGWGALVDEGGNDVYRAEARTDAHATEVVPTDCTGSCTLDVAASTGDALVAGGGLGGLGVGLLRDAGGDDHYIAVARASALAEARNPIANRSAGASAVSGRATVGAWGVGLLAGQGLVHDAGGNDVYTTSTTTRADAVADAVTAGLRRGDAYAGVPTALGQAFGSTGAYGELRDVGGADRYDARATSSATASPDTGVTAEPPVARVQAAAVAEPTAGTTLVGGGALFVDRDGGAADVFASLPASAPCQGTRGRGTWRDCGPIVAVGVND